MTPAAGDGAAATTMSPPTMSEAERYQRLRSHLAFLRLPTATEALPEVLDQARAEGWGLLATLERLLAAEVGAVRWRDPDADLPADFDVHRDTHYQRLRQPLDPGRVHRHAARRADRRA